MTDTTSAPIIPTPDWTRDSRSAFWGTPARNPYLIPLTEVADRIGIQRDSMASNATARPMWFPFEAVTIGRSPDGGSPTRYYRRSDVEGWIRQYLKRQEQAKRARNRAESHGEPRNAPQPYLESCTDDAGERRAA